MGKQKNPKFNWAKFTWVTFQWPNVGEVLVVKCPLTNSTDPPAGGCHLTCPYFQGGGARTCQRTFLEIKGTPCVVESSENGRPNVLRQIHPNDCWQLVCPLTGAGYAPLAGCHPECPISNCLPREEAAAGLDEFGRR